MLANIGDTPIERQFQLLGIYEVASCKQTESLQCEEKFPNNYGHVVLSSVGFNIGRSEAFFYIEHICGLCGGGRYVLMREKQRSLGNGG